MQILHNFLLKTLVFSALLNSPDFALFAGERPVGRKYAILGAVAQADFNAVC